MASVAVDRYYMLAMGYGGVNHVRPPATSRELALAAVNMGLAPLVRIGSWMWRRMRQWGALMSDDVCAAVRSRPRRVFACSRRHSSGLRDVFGPSANRPRFRSCAARHHLFGSAGQTVAIIGANASASRRCCISLPVCWSHRPGSVNRGWPRHQPPRPRRSFLPDLTGRENAALLSPDHRPHDGDARRGRRQSKTSPISASFDRPVHTYSSGMFLRLAFATCHVREPGHSADR